MPSSSITAGSKPVTSKTATCARHSQRVASSSAASESTASAASSGCGSPSGRPGSFSRTARATDSSRGLAWASARERTTTKSLCAGGPNQPAGKGAASGGSAARASAATGQAHTVPATVTARPRPWPSSTLSWGVDRSRPATRSSTRQGEPDSPCSGAPCPAAASSQKSCSAGIAALSLARASRT